MKDIYDKQAEQSVLGSFLLDDKICYKLREINRDMFFFESHKVIFDSMREILDSNKPVDLILLREALERKGVADKISVRYITSLTSVVVTTSNVDHYIKILKEKNLLRQLQAQATELIKAIENQAPLSELTSDIEALQGISINNSSIQDNYLDASEIEVDYSLHDNLSTGFKKLDTILDGFRYGTLTVLSGRPSSGKSTIINQFIASAIDEGQKAFLYSGELPASTVMDWFRNTVVSKEDIKKYQTEYGAKFNAPSEYAVGLIKEWVKDNLFIYSEEALAGESDMLNVIEHLWIKKGVRLFIIDNLMTLAIDNKNDKYEAQKNFVRNLKNLAKKYKLVIILIAHPKKGGDAKSFDMFDVSGASEIINLCDYELAMSRNIDEDNGTDETHILIIKNRVTGKQKMRLRLYFDEERKRLWHLPEERERVYKYDTNKLYEQGDFDGIAPF